MNTFDDDNEPGFFDEPRRRPPRGRPPRSSQRRPRQSGPRRTGPAAGSNSVLRLAVLVALAIAIVFGFVLACSGQSKQDYTSYITAMQPLARNSASIGKAFARAVSTPGLTMQSFQEQLAGWSGQEQNYYIAAQRLQPPGPLQSAHAEALATFQLRYNSLDRLRSTLTVAQEKHASASVAGAALASDAQLLSASDVVWEELYKGPVTDVLNSQNVTNVIVPASQIVTSPDLVSASSLATVYQRLRTPSTGHRVTGIHGSDLLQTNAVQSGVSTSLSKTAATTVFCCSSLVIDVVFEDSGNFPEVQIPVTLMVKAGSTRLYRQKKTVSQIAAGAETTVPFSNIQLPASAFSEQNVSISVNIGKVPGEARLDNNAATYPVFFRIEPPS